MATQMVMMTMLISSSMHIVKTLIYIYMLHNSYCVDDYDDVNLFTSMMMMTTIIILFMLIRRHLGSRQRLTLCCVPSGYQGNLCLEPELRCAVWLSGCGCGGLNICLPFSFPSVRWRMVTTFGRRQRR